MRLDLRWLSLKHIGRKERLLLALLGIVVIAFFYFSSQDSSRASEIQTIERQIAGTAATLQEFLEENDLEALEAQLAELSSLPPVQPFPSRAEVLRFESALFQRVSDVGASIAQLNGIDGAASVGTQDVPAVNYAMTVRGSASALSPACWRSSTSSSRPWSPSWPSAGRATAFPRRSASR